MLFLLLSIFALTEVQSVSLSASAGFRLIHAKTETAVWKSREALRVTEVPSPKGEGGLVMLPNTELRNGTIEIDLTGDVAPNAAEGFRGFVGVAFRVRPDTSKFELFYLRPTNGRAEDQVRRNHSVQYCSHPDYPWSRLRKEFPERYETYADLVPGEWTKVRIELAGTRARFYVQDAKQPTLLVNDLKLGEGSGGIALWVGPGTVAHFANLRITPAK